MSKAEVKLVNVSSPSETIFIKELNVNILFNEELVITDDFTYTDITTANSLLLAIQNDKILIKANGVLQSKADSISYVNSPYTGGGEANTASNIGTGVKVFAQKVGVDLEFRTLISPDFDLQQNTNDVTMSAASDMITNQSSVTPASGMQVLLEDSGILKRGDVSSFLGSGGGQEPYIGNSLISTLDLSGQSSVNNTDIDSYNGFAVGVPFMLQKDVDLNAFIVVQNNATSVGLTAKFGIFKYTGNSGAFTTPYVFTKEYQHPTDINAGITGSQSFTLTTPYTFTAGDVYMCIIVHDTPTLAAGSPDKPAYTGRRTLGQSNIIGINPSNLSQYGRTLQTNSNATISGGNIASTINFDVIGQGNFAATPLIYLDIENA